MSDINPKTGQRKIYPIDLYKCFQQGELDGSNKLAFQPYIYSNHFERIAYQKGYVKAIVDKNNNTKRP